MKRFIVMVAGLALAATSAQAQEGVGVDCGVGGSECTTTKYGMGSKPDFRWNLDGLDAREAASFATSAADFGPHVGTPGDPAISYFFSRTEVGNPVGVDCGPERGHFPLVGQIILQERDDCTPTSEGPSGTCAQGGAACSSLSDCILAGDVAPTTCNYAPPVGQDGGCRVSIPRTDGGITDPADSSELWVFTLAGGVLAFNGQQWSLGAATGNAFSGTSDENNPDCQAFPENIRLQPQTGTRYLLPASHPEYDGSGNQTYLRWDADKETRFRWHTDDSGVCCWSSDGGVSCNAINPGTPQYPALLERSCAETGRFQFDDSITNDWIFAGGAGSAFYSDPSFTAPGQTKGVCKVNRFQGCVLGGADPCPTLDADPGTAGVQPDVCDVTEAGHRIRPLADGNGIPVPTSCNRSQYVVRGTPNEGCTLLPRYEVNGDPGMQCETINYGINHRADQDCDGVADVPVDKCPWLSEWDDAADADGDGERGDECECGDQTGDGFVNVSDILQINASIFDPAIVRLTCDGNNDLNCNIQDILAANGSIFNPNSTTCVGVKPATCGDGSVDPGFGEECDNGAANNDNGPCNTVCQLVP